MTFGTIKVWIQLYLPFSSVKSVNISMKSAIWYTPMSKCLYSQYSRKIDKYIIKKSYKTIVTSEGFLKYHYKDIKSIPGNIVLLPNKLSKVIRNYPFKKRNDFNPNHIRFAFVGGVRYNSLLSLAKHICHNFQITSFISTAMYPKQ